MSFRGTRNNNGRKKGSKNKITATVKDAFAELLEDNIDQMKEDLKELSPKDRLRVLIDLTKFVVPQLKAQEIEVSNNDNLNWLETFDDYDEEQLKTIVDGI